MQDITQLKISDLPLGCPTLGWNYAITGSVD
jgi:hypothetical protein